MTYVLNEVEGVRALVVYEDGELLSATDLSNENFEQILEAARNGEPVGHLISPEETVIERFEQLTDRISIANGQVFLDGDPLNDPVIADSIVKTLYEGGDFMALVNFFEKIQANPSDNSRADLYNWLRAQDASINTNGNVVTYKSVEKIDDYYLSHSSGTAYVNGERQTGRIKQRLGDVVSMRRSEVDDNSGVACSTGLHAGAWSYASTFGGSDSVLLEVEVDPVHFVSVPHDHNHAKARVSQYRVVREIERPHSTFVSTDDYWGEEDEGDYDDYYDGYDYEDLTEEERANDAGASRWYY